MSLPARFAGAMGQLVGPDFPSEIALAVSGGGDSMAMLALAHDWARVFGVHLRVVTVDHGLRPESADEAAMVARECAALGHAHQTLRWHWDGQGNLQDAARRARLDLIDAWRGDIAHVLMAHTQDDAAETFLMRLARGSGVEGLSAMADRRRVVGQAGAFQVIRPLLSVSRADLRHHIDTLKTPYVDDPSNDDPAFDRVKARRALASLGIETEALAATASRLSRAGVALRARAGDVARSTVTQTPTGDLLFDRDAFAGVERDTQLRLLADALQWVSSATYRPRARALDDLLDRALAGGEGTLHGARIFVGRDAFRVAREYNAIKEDIVTLRGDTTWDTRWRIVAPDHDGATLRALGPDGLAQVGPPPKPSPPRDALLALPALFDGPLLLACDLTQKGPQFAATLTPPRGSFVASVVSR